MSLQVGLTGGIASGKSTVSESFREAGFTVVDYDQLARVVVEPGSRGLEAIVERFGSDLLLADGSLDRPALAQVVFNDAEALRDLEAITHPLVRELARDQAGSATAVVVHDNPILVEMGVHETMDLVVVVDAPEEVQMERMVRDRGMSREDALARLRNQFSRQDRLAVADIVIDNSEDFPHLERQIADVITELEEEALLRAPEPLDS